MKGKTAEHVARREQKKKKNIRDVARSTLRPDLTHTTERQNGGSGGCWYASPTLRRELMFPTITRLNTPPSSLETGNRRGRSRWIVSMNESDSKTVFFFRVDNILCRLMIN